MNSEWNRRNPYIFNLVDSNTSTKDTFPVKLSVITEINDLDNMTIYANEDTLFVYKSENSTKGDFSIYYYDSNRNTLALWYKQRRLSEEKQKQIFNRSSRNHIQRTIESDQSREICDFFNSKRWNSLQWTDYTEKKIDSKGIFPLEIGMPHERDKTSSISFDYKTLYRKISIFLYIVLLSTQINVASFVYLGGLKATLNKLSGSTLFSTNCLKTWSDVYSFAFNIELSLPECISNACSKTNIR